MHKPLSSEVYMRSFGRESDQLRPVKLEAGISRHAEGSCLVQCGYTKVLCTASVDEQVPFWMRNTGKGWVSAEYGMLPRATDSRNPREAARGKQSGRTQEIQRLIGRALRSVVDMEALGERQILIDCDVLEADGGTRTAAITGGYVALYQALLGLKEERKIKSLPLSGQVAAISCGILGKQAVLDLDYEEDSSAAVDANFVMTADGLLIEMQGTGEERPFTREEYNALMTLAEKGITELCKLQRQCLNLE